MRKNFDKEACPVCSSEDYTVNDYNEDFDGEESSSRWWSCRCDECGCLFYINYSYELTNISVSRADGN